MSATLPNKLATAPGTASVHHVDPDRDLDVVRAALDAAGVPWVDDDATLDDHARDWWPVSIGWAARGELHARPGIVARPVSTSDVAAVVSACVAAGVPVTPQGGRSGVSGGAIPEPGAVAVDLAGLRGIEAFDPTSLRVRVRAGTFGPELEGWLREQGCTLGLFPQSMELSTVGGWVACRGAGQYSTRYGKIEDLVRGLTVVLPDSSTVATGGRGPREALGPDLTQLFVGSEGTLGIITEVDLVVRRVPPATRRRAYSFDDFDGGLDACRRVLQRGATPAVLRLYDAAESTRVFENDRCVLVVFDEADAILVDATIAVLDEECLGATRESDAIVDRWFEHRNDVSALAPLWERGIVVDTIEVAAPWSSLPALHVAVTQAIRSIEGTMVVTVHESHAYMDGACLYFTFAGRADDPDAFYRAAWDAATHAAVAAGASASHHHGVGRNRARLLADALGDGVDVLRAVKGALDPRWLCNPSVLGLEQP